MLTWIPGPQQRVELSGEPWVARSGSGATLEMGAWPGPSEPRELDHPLSGCGIERQHPGAPLTRHLSHQEEKHNHRHCRQALPALLSHTLQVGTLTSPRSSRGAKVECMETVPIAGLLTYNRNVSQCFVTVAAGDV